MTCPHSFQTKKPDGWYCKKCEERVVDPPVRDWSDGQAPMVIPDIADHINVSTGTRISTRQDIRNLEKEGYVPVEGKVMTGRDPQESVLEAHEKEANADEKRWAHTRKLAFKKSLAQVALEEKR